MGRRTKKLIGTALLVVLVPFYALVVAAFAGTRINEASVVAQVGFYAFFGLIWIVPAGVVIKWMATPRGAEQSRR